MALQPHLQCTRTTSGAISAVPSVSNEYSARYRPDTNASSSPSCTASSYSSYSSSSSSSVGADAAKLGSRSVCDGPPPPCSCPGCLVSVFHRYNRHPPAPPSPSVSSSCDEPVDQRRGGRFRGASGQLPACRSSDSGNAKSLILNRSERRFGWGESPSWWRMWMPSAHARTPGGQRELVMRDERR